MTFDLGDGIRLRLVEPGDAAAYAAAYDANRAHLARWDPVRDESFYTVEWHNALVTQFLRDHSDGRAARFVLAHDDGRILGVANINNVVRGAFHSADLGYWIDASLAGRGVMSRAVAIVIDYARAELELHRLQAGTLLDNAASQRVLLRNGFEQFGMAPKYLRIAGEWQDHLLFQRILSDS
ncbi:GNAT family N-acetyltransferase [Microbacterium sp.]|uniref:GNAT family N-acetyltransferase n=1 Tax=Microbacterium sp. TaxID=51671 RepID=UPI002732E34D|nr:GNAT family N-acetyltransferase [Microbacterium sp.]MDP3950681.1 GNAT family N-acetyltransferase [Microbacterium sp.]